jgi:uncharacterized protein YcbX
VNAAGQVERIWRYPVKSVRGETLASAEVVPGGIVGDRRFAVADADGKLGSGKSNRWFRKFDQLLAMSARYDADGVLALTLPDGRTLRQDEACLDDELRAALGRGTVRLAREGERPEWSAGYNDGSELHLITTASLGWLAAVLPDAQIDERRMRPNLVLRTEQREELVEDAWLGRTLLVGEQVRLLVEEPCERCVMVNAAQAELPQRGDILKTLADRNAMNLGVLARVLTGGTVHVGDPVTLA